MATHPAAGDGKTELITVRPVALAGVELEPGTAQPAHGQILEVVADREDSERPAVEPGTEQQLNASADGNQTTTANAGAGH